MEDFFGHLVYVFLRYLTVLENHYHVGFATLSRFVRRVAEEVNTEDKNYHKKKNIFEKCKKCSLHLYFYLS